MSHPEITDDLIDPICQIADLGLSETDTLLNQLILAARKVKEREGFFVVDGNDEPAVMSPNWIADDWFAE